ncbi:arylsulfatase K isoform X2 [Tachysurus vachellii]|uniref:arylsulfatase K isoform X2 n=1 Tax=Tachysurus vachellii TaxID=175792 RepID=UPI00296B05EA|nr:arylsulfatase K isoform X2 [Tachysurus vachellii]
MKTFPFFLLLVFSPQAQCLYLNRTSEQKPNIVMVMSDAFDGRLTFNPGNKVVQLPYINYMRQMGAIFLNSYSNSPICCPSRAAMWSGMFVHLTQAWNNYKCLSPNFTTWMDHLQKAGYQTHRMGKLDYTSGSHSVSNRVEAWTREVAFLLRQEGRPVADLVGNRSTVRIMTKDWNTTDSAVQWIRQKAKALSQPFALYLGLNLPHPYCTKELGSTAGGSTFRTSPYWLKKVATGQVSLPKWLPFSQMHPVDYYSTVTKNCSGNFSAQEIRDIRASYYAMCAETDSMLGKVIAVLRDTGLLNSTVLLFTSDHGDLAMEHRQFYKMSMFEGSSHVPLLIMGPDFAGIPIPYGLSGYSVVPLISQGNKQSTVSHPGWILSEYHGCNANASTYMLRIDKWKYITYSDGLSVPSQLFDLSVDEAELKNVASRYPVVCQHLDKLLRSVVDYPNVTEAVQQYNRQQFLQWKQSLGNNYTQVIGNLRWHMDWQKNSRKNEEAIEDWLDN